MHVWIKCKYIFINRQKHSTKWQQWRLSNKSSSKFLFFYFIFKLSLFLDIFSPTFSPTGAIFKNILNKGSKILTGITSFDEFVIQKDHIFLLDDEIRVVNEVISDKML